MPTILLMIPFFLLFAWLMLAVKRLQWRGRRSPFNENILRVPGHSLRRAQNSNAFDTMGNMLGVLILPLLGYSAYKGGVSNIYIVLMPFALITGWFFY